MDPNGRLTFRMRGRPPQNEDGADAAAWTLIERLNQLGARWGEPGRPSGPERGIDFVAHAGDSELHIQVTRAFSDTSAFRELARESLVSRTVVIDDAVAALWSSIERKRGSAGGDVVLALDATVPAGFAPVQLMIAFRRRHGAQARVVGFASVWLVGPTAMLTWRLDEPLLADEPVEFGF